MAAVLNVTTRNAKFQQWEALLTNRNKRQRSGEFLVQGVRPISLAIQYGWQINALLFDASRPLSGWATGLLDTVETTMVAMSPQLLAELGEKAETPPELIAVVALADDDLSRIPVDHDMVVVGLDRPTSPGNVGTVIRSADALGAAGVIVTGHAADIYDSKAVRASTGSLFALPTVRTPSSQAAVDWVESVRGTGVELRIVGTDEQASADIADFDLTRPTLLLVGNETTGLSSGWREVCDDLVQIPITGGASSLNAATAASIVLYEAARQRRQR